MKILLLLPLLLAADPAPVQPPAAAPKQTCYAASCGAKAEPGEAVKVRSQCVPGYKPDTAILPLSSGIEVVMCICCPAVASSIVEEAAPTPSSKK